MAVRCLGWKAKVIKGMEQLLRGGGEEKVWRFGLMVFLHFFFGEVYEFMGFFC